MGVAPSCWATWTASAVLGITAVSAAAQSTDPLTPGAISDTLTRPVELQAPAPVEAPVPPPRPEAPAEAGARTVTVQGFEFSGNTVFSSEQLSALVADYTGRPVSLIQLYEAADRITSHYVEAGYTLASALLPAQKISDGSVQLEVIEGRIDKIVYEGLKRYRPATLDTFVEGTAGTIYRGSQFEAGLRNVDALPGLDAKAVLRPGAAFGTTDVVVQVTEKPVDGVFFVDNSGRDTIGETRFAAQVSFNNPLRVGDQLTLLALRSAGSQLEYGSAAYSLPVNSQGLRLNLNAGYAKFELDGAFRGVRGSNANGRIELEQPVWRGGPRQLTVTGAVAGTRADTDFSGVPLRGTELLVFELGGTLTQAYRNGAISQLTGNIGSNFKEADGGDPNAQRIRLELDAQHIEPLPMSLQLVGRGLFTYSPDPLPDTQQFSLGGPSSVRGYAPSEVRGDWGYFGSLTLRRNYPLGAAVISPRLFVDAGRVRSRDPSGSVPEISLSSVGVGADASLSGISLKLDYAIPTDGLAVSDGKDDGRVYGTFAVQF